MKELNKIIIINLNFKAKTVWTHTNKQTVSNYHHSKALAKEVQNKVQIP